MRGHRGIQPRNGTSGTNHPLRYDRHRNDYGRTHSGDTADKTEESQEGEDGDRAGGVGVGQGTRDGALPTSLGEKPSKKGFFSQWMFNRKKSKSSAAGEGGRRGRGGRWQEVLSTRLTA